MRTGKGHSRRTTWRSRHHTARLSSHRLANRLVDTIPTDTEYTTTLYLPFTSNSGPQSSLFCRPHGKCMSASLMEIFEMSRLMLRAEIALKCCGYRNCLLRVVVGIEMCFRGLSVEILDHYFNPVRKNKRVSTARTYSKREHTCRKVFYIRMRSNQQLFPSGLCIGFLVEFGLLIVRS